MFWKILKHIIKYNIPVKVCFYLEKVDHHLNHPGIPTITWGEGIICGIQTQNRNFHIIYLPVNTGVCVVCIVVRVTEENTSEAAIKLQNGLTLKKIHNII